MHRIYLNPGYYIKKLGQRFTLGYYQRFLFRYIFNGKFFQAKRVKSLENHPRCLEFKLSLVLRYPGFKWLLKNKLGCFICVCGHLALEAQSVFGVRSSFVLRHVRDSNVYLIPQMNFNSMLKLSLSDKIHVIL
jgi:hypothetical protein